MPHNIRMHLTGYSELRPLLPADPHDDDILEPLRKCLTLDAVPVIIGRCIP